MSNFLTTLKNIIKETPPARAYRRKKYDSFLATPEKIGIALKTYVKKSLTADERTALINDIKRTAKEFRFDADEYFMYHLYEKTDKEKCAFISDREGQEIRARLNKGKNREIFDNKWEAYCKFSKYYGREVCFFKSDKEYSTFEALLKKHGSLIVKPIVDGCGHGIRKITVGEDNRKQFDMLVSELRNGFVAEEVIVQDAGIAQFHPRSVNTLRITTIRLSDQTLVIHPFVRFGTGERVVDNGGCGGLICTIRPDTGEIYSAVDELDNKYEKHPDTGLQIIGYKIPRWEEAIKLAKELAQVIPDNRYTGWDLALTEKGWIMVEGNASGMFVGWQLNDQVGFRSEIEGYLKQLGIKY